MLITVNPKRKKRKEFTFPSYSFFAKTSGAI